MSAMQRGKIVLMLACVGAFALSLSACAPDAPADDAGARETLPATQGSGDDAEAGDEDAAEEASGDFVVIAGTGRYAVGTDVPFGGYQLSGEPVGQPAGCTWSIQDDDGVVAFENQGSYVFLTDIKEGTVFVTDGCPEWEQFE